MTNDPADTLKEIEAQAMRVALEMRDVRAVRAIALLALLDPPNDESPLSAPESVERGQNPT